MTFVAGALIGGVAGLGAGLVLGRRGRAVTTEARQREWRVIVTAIAALALVVAAVALARSDRRDHPAAAAPVTTTTPATAPVPDAPTTTRPPIGGTVSVPNVVGSARNLAVATLEKAGLRVTVDSLALANVPAGFVISQNPLPAGLVPPGTTVALVVSAAT